MSTKNKTLKATKTTAKPDAAAKRSNAVAKAQAADAAANAHAVKPTAKGTKIATVNAGGGIMVDVVEISPEQKVANAAAEALAQTPAPAKKGKRIPWRERAAVINANNNEKFAAEQAANDGAKAAKAPKTPKEPKVKKTSGLDAAVQVLKDKGEPMSCKDIVETMLAKGMWKTGGKTPAATIYSAMLREIDNKPAETRFTKTGRGLFALAKTKA